MAAALATRVETIAAWAHRLTIDDVPAEVVDLARAQRRSVLGGVAASAGDAAAGRMLDGVASWAGEGPAPLVGTDRTVAAEDAVYAAAGLSIALDFDDYVSFGHTGHSAVLVPLLLAAETGSTAKEQLVAQLVASEVEARLGGACLIGPQNGQLWSFIHAAGAALAAGTLLGLDHRQLAHALAIALYQPPRATVPGFMAPDSKLLTAAEPAVMGMRAARLAGAGVTGPLDALDHEDGFFGAFSFAPIPGLLGGLGEGWAMRTLCVKPVPGCAYIDTTVDALMSLGPPPADEVERVTVSASLLTCAMDALSSRYARGVPTPVTMNFSIPLNVAALLLSGELTPRQADAGWLAANADALADIARRVSLRHDWAATREAAAAFARLLPPGRLVRDAGRARLAAGLRRVRAAHPAALSLRDLRDVSGLIGGVGRTRQMLDAARGGDFWDDAALSRFAMTFPASVSVHLRSGETVEATAAVPRGGAGHPVDGAAAVSQEKLATWGPALWGAAGTEAIGRAVDSDDDGLSALLHGAVEPVPGRRP